MNSWDVIVAGAGICGLSAAQELRERGASVLVLERGQPGCEASTAAAGMLAATDPETPAALQELALAAAGAYPAWVNTLQSRSGIDVDFRRQGSIVLGEENPAQNYQRLSEEELRRLEPSLEAKGYPAFYVAEDCIDPVLLMRALMRAAELSGVELMTGVEVHKMRWTGSDAEVATNSGGFRAQAAVKCLGAWSGTPVKPRKGQMMYLQPRRGGLLQHVVRAPGAYIVPRSSGKILVGTTVEDVGFDKTVVPETIRRMHESASEYVPELAHAQIFETWSGLRPGTPDDLPVIGPAEEKNVFIASGLFRNGILLAPMVATVMADLVAGNATPLDISAFSPARFALKEPRNHASGESAAISRDSVKK